jgi:hypothetical protein
MKIDHQSKFAQVKIHESPHKVNLYMYIQRRLPEIKTHIYCKLISSSMTGQHSLLSPSNILPPLLFHVRKEKFGASFNECCYSNFLLPGKCLCRRVFVFYAFSLAIFLRSDVISQVCPTVYFNPLWNVDFKMCVIFSFRTTANAHWSLGLT